MIRLYRVSKEYAGVGALIDVSVHVTKGEFCYISGPSGAGKSTLLKLLYGAIKPTRGKLLINNIDMGPANDRDIAHLRDLAEKYNIPLSLLFASGVSMDKPAEPVAPVSN